MFVLHKKIEKTGSLKWHNIELKCTRFSMHACNNGIAGYSSS